jgi:hypothetical protein
MRDRAEHHARVAGVLGGGDPQGRLRDVRKPLYPLPEHCLKTRGERNVIRERLFPHKLLV